MRRETFEEAKGRVIIVERVAGSAILVKALRVLGPFATILLRHKG